MDPARYEHRQFGTLTAVLLLAGIAFGVWFGVRTGWDPVAILLLGVLVPVLALFYDLTVTVDGERIRCSFGIGLITKTIPLADVKAAERVRNHWWYGWGIRRVPGAWMYNVSGLDAVEIVYTSGKRFRIGTDDPDGLVAAIRGRIRD